MLRNIIKGDGCNRWCNNRKELPRRMPHGNVIVGTDQFANLSNYLFNFLAGNLTYPRGI